MKKKKRKKRRRLRKKRVTILLLCIGLIVFLIITLCNAKKKNGLEKLGYNNLEIKEIKKLSNKEIKTIANNKYNKNLINYLKSDYYDKNNLKYYLKYSNKYEKINYEQILELISNNNFEEKNISKYFKLLKKYENIDGIINYVNNYLDKDIELNEINLGFIGQKYFIYDYLDRYLNYYKDNPDLGYEEIVTRINSNLDYTFYVDSKKADTSKNMYTLVNKFNYLDENYIPDNLVNISGKYARDNASLVDIAFENFKNMADDASKENLTIKITTGYRSYYFQSTLYNNYVGIDGKEKADTYSARPGYSEHQLGYSCDITDNNNVSFQNFKYTEEYKWLQDNAYKYGFIQRYPEGKEYITGFIFESWHYRYVGVDIATYIYENNITYEEYYAYFLR